MAKSRFFASEPPHARAPANARRFSPRPVAVSDSDSSSTSVDHTSPPNRSQRGLVLDRIHHRRRRQGSQPKPHPAVMFDRVAADLTCSGVTKSTTVKGRVTAGTNPFTQRHPLLRPSCDPVTRAAFVGAAGRRPQPGREMFLGCNCYFEGKPKVHDGDDCEDHRPTKGPMKKRRKYIVESDDEEFDCGDQNSMYLNNPSNVTVSHAPEFVRREFYSCRISLMNLFGARMLVFPSTLLPEKYQSTYMEHYLWSAFKRKEEQQQATGASEHQQRGSDQCCKKDVASNKHDEVQCRDDQYIMQETLATRSM
ncbi:hypothetical protein GUJ93_ZPchr0009g419 [Zizania palustris]|uniref:Uncharacterized protein n=1 Tax=Zizania palustris TaxID=103762 RepID=A0A8J5S4R4_ZIZPA|nr:hypothetical protein GUJ93_ZPchr0009g419 [Zizania palustris]